MSWTEQEQIGRHIADALVSRVDIHDLHKTQFEDLPLTAEERNALADPDARKAFVVKLSVILHVG